MRILNQSQMRRVEEQVIKQQAITSLELMENAGRSVFDIIKGEFGTSKKRFWSTLFFHPYVLSDTHLYVVLYLQILLRLHLNFLKHLIKKFYHDQHDPLQL